MRSDKQTGAFAISQKLPFFVSRTLDALLAEMIITLIYYKGVFNIAKRAAPNAASSRLPVSDNAESNVSSIT